MKSFLGSTAVLSCMAIKTTSARAKTKKRKRLNLNIFSIIERKVLAYRYFFSMSDVENHRESGFFYPEDL